MLKTTDRRLKGEIAELKVQLRAAEKGVLFSKTIVSARYDAIIDDGIKLERVQIKYGDGKPSHSSGCVAVELRRRKRVYSELEVDALLVYIPMLDKIVRLPADKFCGKSSVYLRIKPCANYPNSRVLMVTNFLW